MNYTRNRRRHFKGYGTLINTELQKEKNIMPRTYVGFGFGAIQAGLLLLEAHRSDRLQRLVVAEVMDDVVEAMRHDNGRYRVNIARCDGIDIQTVDGVEIYNPNHADDRRALIAAVAEASDIGTALPSVDFFARGGECSVAAILAAGFSKRRSPGVVYTAENHNHAAETLENAVANVSPSTGKPVPIQYLNTVVGKMSGVVTNPEQIQQQQLAPVTTGSHRCFLVEAFNRILISCITLPDFQRGIDVFEEKTDLLPFEEAKLYGHNAVHALLGYLAHQTGLTSMHEAANHPELMTEARAAFIEESGRALIARHRGIDPLFTESGFAAYADDLLQRMVNPYLRDGVERIIRDPRRKLGWDDRLVGTMRLAHAQDIVPRRFAHAAAIALHNLAIEEKRDPAELLQDIWAPAAPSPGEQAAIRDLILAAV